MSNPGRLRQLALTLVSRRRWLLLSAFTLGFLAALGQAPFGFFPATLLGLSGAFALSRVTATVKRAALLGWGLGAGYFTLTLIWIVQPFLVDIGRHGWMAPFALAGLAGGLALFWSAGCAAARALTRRRLTWLAWPAMMSAAELARGSLFSGFPWGGPGAIWVNTPVLPLGAYVGASGLSFLTFLLASTLYAAARQPRPLLPLAGILAAGAAAVSLAMLRGGVEIPPPESPKMLRIVQPNAAQHLKWDPSYVFLFLDRQMELTAAPPDPSAAAPDLVIWPETAVPYLLDRAPEVLADIAETAAPAQVALGIQRSEGQRYFNSMVVLGSGGDVQALYDKHHLVPFGEYTPAGDLLHRLGLRGFAAQHGYGYSAGPGAAILDLGALGKVLPLICYEAIFARDLRAAPSRADWILQVTNDAWFGTFSGPQQHLAQAQLRAVEQGLPFVRAANTGISAVIDAHGRVVARLGLGRAGKLDVALPGALPPSVYARLGDAPLTLLLILVVAGLALTRRRISD